MSLPQFCSQSFLFSTAALSGCLFAANDRYRLFAARIFPLLLKSRAQLAGCYCQDNGRAAVEPVLLLGVSLLQFLEGQPDRAAVEMLRYHAGWNFALNRQLGGPVFHPTSLVNFRQRLIEHDLSAVGFQSILDGLVEAGLLARQSRQRLDSTQIFAKLSRMSRLECMRETLRLALQELEASSADLARPDWWSLLWERYVESQFDYRVEAAVLRQKMTLAGTDAATLLAWLRNVPLAKLREGQQVKLLERVFNQQFELNASAALQQRKAQPAGAVHNPHDPEAQWAAKGQGKQRKEHVGYKLQVAETVTGDAIRAKGEPTLNFITAVVAEPAITSDDAGLPQVEQQQLKMGLEKPGQWHVDGAYVSAERLAQAQAAGRQLIGPAQPAPRKPGRFSVEDFQINLEQRKAKCPDGKTSTQCSRLQQQQSGKVQYRFEFSWRCHRCQQRARCLGKGQRHRTLTVGEYHSFLQARRIEQRSEAFKKKAHRRNAIEGTHSELFRAHGLKRARYRGLAKMQLQSYFAAGACNLKRWIRRETWTMAQLSRRRNPSKRSGI